MHPCARCALMQKTCCQRAEIVVTGGDVARIAAVTQRHDFWERRVPVDPSYAASDPDDPAWRELTVAPDGTRRVLRRTVDGDCTFLGPSGCTLATGTRPLVCRLYPHSYTERGLDGLDDEYCPREVLAGPGRTMLDVLDIARTDALRWHATLYAELHADAAVRSVGETSTTG
ncbi:MAG: YkgJ family cysteine cluster protein [Planctomycetes bacterium]|nr:YkgJ family cysteine cluster protein [Planctomycetota bacterium]